MSVFSNYFIAISYFLAGVVNTIPAIGVISSARLTSLYGIDVVSDDMSLLLRHRAVLFLIVGLLLLTSVFIDSLRLVSGLAGLLSMVSFALLAWSLPEINASLQRIVTVDIIASVLLLLALILNQRAAWVVA